MNTQEQIAKIVTTMEYRELKRVQHGGLIPPRKITFDEVMKIKDYEKYQPKVKCYLITHSNLGGTLFMPFGSLGEFEATYVDKEMAEVKDKYTIEVIEMPKEEFDNLPEFECFE